MQYLLLIIWYFYLPGAAAHKVDQAIKQGTNKQSKVTNTSTDKISKVTNTSNTDKPKIVAVAKKTSEASLVQVKE